MAEDTKEEVPFEDQKRAAEIANEETASKPGGTTYLSHKWGAETLSSNEQRAKLERENRTDFLTGLPNERALGEMVSGLESRWERAKSEGETVNGTFIAFDLTGLKKVNDEISYEVGDEYLRECAKILVGEVREEDRVLRNGKQSDEFIVHIGGLVYVENINGIIYRINRQFELLQKEYQKKYPDIEMSVSSSATRYGNELSPRDALKRSLDKLGKAKREKRKAGERGAKVEIGTD